MMVDSIEANFTYIGAKILSAIRSLQFDNSAYY